METRIIIEPQQAGSTIWVGRAQWLDEEGEWRDLCHPVLGSKQFVTRKVKETVKAFAEVNA